MAANVSDHRDAARRVGAVWGPCGAFVRGITIIARRPIGMLIPEDTPPPGGGPPASPPPRMTPAIPATPASDRPTPSALACGPFGEGVGHDRQGRRGDHRRADTPGAVGRRSAWRRPGRGPR